MTEYIPLIGFVFLLLLLLWYLSKKGKQQMEEIERKIRNARKARAKILAVGYVGLRGRGNFGDYQAYKFNLEVTCENMPPYKASSVWEVSMIASAKVQEGMDVRVKVDADDQNIIYPSIEGVGYSVVGNKLAD